VVLAAFGHPAGTVLPFRIMPPHSVGSGTISFGLVSIPVRLYTATSPAAISFNLLHAPCGSRIRQQTFCPVCNTVVERGELVKGYEFARDQYVRITDAELKAVEGEASQVIEIAEFVPLERVDPIYFERAYFLGPDRGGEKAYRLLADALEQSRRVALATFVMRGKESLVLLRAARGGLLLHTMYFADEVRDFGEIDKGASARIRDGELALALQLVDALTTDDFKPDRYADTYRQRVLDMIQRKVEGQEVTTAATPPPRGEVIDLMKALEESLAKRGPVERKPPARIERAGAAPQAAEARPARGAAGGKKAQGGKK
jgi:DNA end-binding protein Ku